jgi:hypothetical protein
MLEWSMMTAKAAERHPGVEALRLCARKVGADQGWLSPIA